MLDESWFFCNEWKCEHRKNEKHKNEMLCDMVYDGCPYDEEYFENQRNRKEVENEINM